MSSCTLSKIIQFPPSTHHYLAPNKALNNVASLAHKTMGGILADTAYFWLANGPRFQVLRRNGTRIAAWTFGSHLNGLEIKVACVAEIYRPGGKLPLLAIALDFQSRGMICIFDVIGSKVLRTIEMPDRITSLHVVHSGYDVCPIPGLLQCFDGILAVGFVGGDVLLVDIYRQTCDEVLSGCNVDEARDELNPCEMVILTADDLGFLELHKGEAFKNGKHVALHLNAVMNEASPHFILKGPKGDNRILVNKVEVTVSALHYCQQLSSLLVGYNFGSLQQWNLTDMNLMYTSPVQEDNMPISHFSVLEPADDPRASCYIWAIYSHKEFCKNSFPIAVLYSFNYHLKEWHEGYGYLYQNFVSVSIRFEVDLHMVDNRRTNAKPQGACCTGVVALNKNSHGQFNEMQESNESSTAMCSLVWNVFCSELEIYTYLLIFDLNQWYKEELPRAPDWDSCSNYMISVCLSELTNSNQIQKAPSLDVRLKSFGLNHFMGVQRLEEHYYPSSLSFECLCLRESDAFVLVNQGIQRSFLSHLESTGPITVIRPMQAYKKAVQAGLTPIFVDALDFNEASLNFQREFILSVALEQQLISWLHKCASEWANGNYSSVGCTLEFLLTWAWRRVSALKANIDKICVPLFDYTGVRLDSNRQNILNSGTRQLKHICSLFAFILSRFKSFVPCLEVVEQQYETLGKISTYLEVLQWLLNVGLLPECPLSSFPLDEGDKISAPYPFESLMEYYNNRRATLNDLDTDGIGRGQKFLFIDNVINFEFGVSLQKQWEADGGTGLYPPPSLQALLRTYLVDGVDLNIKHCLIIYVFLDLAMALDQSRYKPVITHLIKFPAVFKVSPSIIKITQAFWQLDHGDFSTAIEQLLDPLVSTQDLKAWHHRTALYSLLIQGQFNYALQYLQVRQPPIILNEDMNLIISLYVGNNLMDEAFYFYEKRKSNEEDFDLLKHFYYECGKHDKLRKLLYRSFTPQQEKVFMDFLASAKHHEEMKLQIFYFILRSRYLDAVNATKNGRTNEIPIYDLLLGSCFGALPEVNRKLIEVCSDKEFPTFWQQMPKSQPLSVLVHKTNAEGIRYKSSLINSSLLKARETWLNVNDEEAVNRKFALCSDDIPFLRTPNVTPVVRNRGSVHKHKLTDDEENMDGASPSKRLKLSPRQSLLPDSHKNLSKNQSLTSEVSSLTHLVHLDTPIVKRRGSRGSSSLQTPNIGTPHSILKVRNLLKFDSNTPSNDLRILENAEDSNQTKNATLERQKSSLNLTPRKPVARTSGLMVTFDDSKCFSSTVCDAGAKKSKDSTESSSDAYYSPNVSPQKSDLSKTDSMGGENDIQGSENVPVLTTPRKSYKKSVTTPVNTSKSSSTLSTDSSGKIGCRRSLRQQSKLTKTSLIEVSSKETRSVTKTVEKEVIKEKSTTISNIKEKDAFIREKLVVKRLHTDSAETSKMKVTDSISDSDLTGNSDFSFKCEPHNGPRMPDSLLSSNSEIEDAVKSSRESLTSSDNKEPETSLPSTSFTSENSFESCRSRLKARKPLSQRVLLKNTIAKLEKSVSGSNFKNEASLSENDTSSDFEFPSPDVSSKAPVFTESMLNCSTESGSEATKSFASAESSTNKDVGDKSKPRENAGVANVAGDGVKSGEKSKSGQDAINLDDSSNNSAHFGVIDPKMNVFEVSGEINVNYNIYDVSPDTGDNYGVSNVELYGEEDEVLCEEISEHSSTGESETYSGNVSIEEPSNDSHSDEAEAGETSKTVKEPTTVEIIEIDDSSSGEEEAKKSNSSPEYSEDSNNSSVYNLEPIKIVPVDISEEEQTTATESSASDSSVESKKTERETNTPENNNVVVESDSEPESCGEADEEDSNLKIVEADQVEKVADVAADLIEEPEENSETDVGVSVELDSKDGAPVTPILKEIAVPARRTRSASLQNETSEKSIRTSGARRKSVEFNPAVELIEITPKPASRKRSHSFADRQQTPEKRTLRARSNSSKEQTPERRDAAVGKSADESATPSTLKRRLRSNSTEESGDKRSLKGSGVEKIKEESVGGASNGRRKLRSTGSAPEVLGNATCKRRLRSSSIDVAAETSDKQKAPKSRNRSASISQLPTICEEAVSSAKATAGSKQNKSKSVLGIENYATTRRMTRRQVNLLKKMVDPEADIKAVAEYDDDVDGDDDEEEHRGPVIDEIDPIELLDKQSFRGKPDPEEKLCSPKSTDSESSAGTRSSILQSSSVKASGKRGQNKKPPTSSSLVKERLRRKSVDQDSSAVESVTPVKRVTRSSQDQDESEAKSVCSTRSRTKSVLSNKSGASSRGQEKSSTKLKTTLPKISEETVEKSNRSETPAEKCEHSKPKRKRSKSQN